MEKLKKVLDTSNRKIKSINPLVDGIIKLNEEMEKLTDDELYEVFSEIKSDFEVNLNDESDFKQEQALMNDHLVEVFAVIREAAWRTLGMKAYPVQLMGAIVLHQGEVAEMATGEGKTLVGVFPAILNALVGKGVFVVSVNDYLTKRDLETNKPLFDFLSLSSGYIVDETEFKKRQDVYQRDIVYIENTQLGFDYLQDNRIVDPKDKMQRNLYYCIADEVDSVLLDEARTPMVLTIMQDEVSPLYKKADEIVKNLEERHYTVYDEYSSVVLTDEGIDKVQEILQIDQLLAVENQEINHYIYNALCANYFMKNNEFYVVKDGRVILIDENTGRLNNSHRMNDGLHQSLEAKEGVEIKKESVTLNSVTYQQFFKKFKKISGMSGTAITESREFLSIYNLLVIRIPSNKPLKRVDLRDLVYSNMLSKYKAITKRVKEANHIGRPVLIGVNTISQAEELSKFFINESIQHEVLTAKSVEREAKIVEKAGIKGAVTIATNMAGRGTDIKLGEGVPELGGLLIVGTEKNVNRRVDLQLRGRSGRQGDVGESVFYLSLEDDMVMIHGNDAMRYALNNVSENAKSRGREDGYVSNPILLTYLDRSQLLLEGRSYDSRKKTVEYDSVVESQRDKFFSQRESLLKDKGLLLNIVKGADNVDIERISKFLTEIESKDVENEVHVAALRLIDKSYVSYLKRLEDIKYEVQLVGHAGESPVQAYYFRTHKAFEEMSKSIQNEIALMIESYC